MTLPDLNSAEHIDDFVHRFYHRLLQDKLLSPLFLQEADIDLQKHLPQVSLYWKKILLGDKRYGANTIAIHRNFNAIRPIQEQHYQRWLLHFEETALTFYAGDHTDKALRVARKIIGNMKNLFDGVADD